MRLTSLVRDQHRRYHAQREPRQRILKNWWQQCGADRRGKLTQGDSASPLIVSRWRHDNPSGAAQPGRSLRRGVAVSGRQLAGDRGAARGQGGGADRREYPAERAERPTEPEAERDGERRRSLAATVRQGRSAAATPGAPTAQERTADCRRGPRGAAGAAAGLAVQGL